MLFDLDSIQRFINSPPGQLTAGPALATFVWGVATWVENLLTDDTKLEIAVGLLGVKTETPARGWQDLMVNTFEAVFGKKHLTWRCAASSLSLAAILSVFGIMMMLHYGWLEGSAILVGLELLVLLSIPVYGSVWAMREGVHRMIASGSAVRAVGSYLVACCQATFFAAWFVLFPPLNPFWKVHTQASAAAKPGAMLAAFVVFVFWTYLGIPSVLLLYLVSVETLKAARRFDIGFQWFNQKFDIEKKPLQCVGSVAGVIVALLYWGTVLVVHLF